MTGDDGLRCFCDRDRAGHGWSLDEGCTQRPVTTKPDLLRDAIRHELSEWEVFLDGDGDRSIRRREGRSPDDLADAILALPEIAALRAKAATADQLLAVWGMTPGEEKLAALRAAFADLATLDGGGS